MPFPSHSAFCLSASGPALRVCADPNNLPYSSERGDGFENRIAELVGRELGVTVEYVWWAQRKQFVRETLESGRCDVLAGVPANLPGVLATGPYYRSMYVFVSRADRHVRVRSLDDALLKKLRTGIHVVGIDYAPPAFLLARHGVVGTLVPYSLYGGFGEQNPPARLIDAVARGDVDLGIAWGPVAGYFAARERVPLDIAPVPADPSVPEVPMAYDMAMAVRKNDSALRDKIDRVLQARRAEIAESWPAMECRSQNDAPGHTPGSLGSVDPRVRPRKA